VCGVKEKRRQRHFLRYNLGRRNPDQSCPSSTACRRSRDCPSHPDPCQMSWSMLAASCQTSRSRSVESHQNPNPRQKKIRTSTRDRHNQIGTRPWAQSPAEGSRCRRIAIPRSCRILPQWLVALGVLGATGCWHTCGHKILTRLSSSRRLVGEESALLRPS
jgi:hypothetical protein